MLRAFATICCATATLAAQTGADALDPPRDVAVSTKSDLVTGNVQLTWKAPAGAS